MKQIVKAIIFILNIIVLCVAIYWYKNPDENIEPIIVIFIQVIALIVISIDYKLGVTSVKNVEKSNVEIETTELDKSKIFIENISEDSNITIKRK